MHTVPIDFVPPAIVKFVDFWVFNAVHIKPQVLLQYLQQRRDTVEVR